jgi:hypothetical protein
VTVVIINCASVLFMTGLGYLVQFVAYPLFAMVGRESFTDYHAGWSTRISPVVAPMMIIELGSSAWLVAAHPEFVSTGLAVSGLVCSVAVWASTFALQVPAHSKLESGFDASVHRRLVRSSWLRTLAWATHSVIVCAMLASTPS